MSGIINLAGSKSGVIGKKISSNNYIVLSGGSASVGTSPSDVTWGSSTLNSLATHSSGVLTFTVLGAGTYHIVASLNAYDTSPERWFGCLLYNGSSNFQTSYQAIVGTLDGDGSYGNPVATGISTFASGGTFTVKTASSAQGSATFYGTSHCMMLKIG